MNAFLAKACSDEDLRNELRESDAEGAAALAARAGFDVTVGDLVRHQSRATTWQLSDDELAVVASWQPKHRVHWWQCIWD